MIVKYIKQHCLPDICRTACFNKSSASLNAKQYPHGAVQPAFVFFVGNQPAISWACQPRAANLQGSVCRPKPDLVWKVVMECKKRLDNGQTFECVDGGELEKSCSVSEVLFKTCCVVS